jgi:hypothetical protein
VDIGRIKVRDKVDFTVDSNPSRIYHGEVLPQGKLPLRLNANMNSNVVTYTVVVSVNNDDLALRPYQTANLSFIVDDKENTLIVSNAALRWQPNKDQIAPDQRASYFQLKNKKHGPTDPDATDHGVIWTPSADGFVRYIEVRTGLTDGVKTEILGTFKNDENGAAKTEAAGNGKDAPPADVQTDIGGGKRRKPKKEASPEAGPPVPEGTLVIVGEEKKSAGGNGGNNPFTTQIFRGNSNKPKE